MKVILERQVLAAPSLNVALGGIGGSHFRAGGGVGELLELRGRQLVEAAGRLGPAKAVETGKRGPSAQVGFGGHPHQIPLAECTVWSAPSACRHTVAIFGRATWGVFGNGHGTTLTTWGTARSSTLQGA